MGADDAEDDSCGSTDPRGSCVAGGQCIKGRISRGRRDENTSFIASTVTATSSHVTMRFVIASLVY